MADEETGTAAEGESIADRFTRAVRDLWTMHWEADDQHIVFMDRRRLPTRVDRRADGTFTVSWETEAGDWTVGDRVYDDLREAAFHGYQGPH